MKVIFSSAVAVVLALSLMTLDAFASSANFSALSSSVTKSQSTDNRTWQISLNAQLLKIDNTFVWVHIQSPDNMQINESDHVQPLQRLPITKNIIAADSNNNPIAIGNIVPGQNVRVKFTYKFVGSDRVVTPVECRSIVTYGTLLKPKSTKKISELKNNTAVATIIQIDKNEATIFIEGGKILVDNKKYDITGMAVINLSSSSVTDVNGKKTSPDCLKKNDRIAVSLKNHVWRETDSTTYAGGNAVSVQVLGIGENIIKNDVVHGPFDLEDEIADSNTNPTSEDILKANPEADIFVYKGVVCLRVSSTHWAFNETYEPLELIGNISKTEETGKLDELEARFLPIGTEIYSTKSFEIVLAKMNDSKSYIKYQLQLEG